MRGFCAMWVGFWRLAARQEVGLGYYGPCWPEALLVGFAPRPHTVDGAQGVDPQGKGSLHSQVDGHPWKGHPEPWRLGWAPLRVPFAMGMTWTGQCDGVAWRGLKGLSP